MCLVKWLSGWGHLYGRMCVCGKLQLLITSLFYFNKRKWKKTTKIWLLICNSDSFPNFYNALVVHFRIVIQNWILQIIPELFNCWPSFPLPCAGGGPGPLVAPSPAEVEQSWIIGLHVESTLFTLILYFVPFRFLVQRTSNHKLLK